MKTTEEILNEISNNVYGQKDWKQLVRFFIDKQLPETAIRFIEELIERTKKQ